MGKSSTGASWARATPLVKEIQIAHSRAPIAGAPCTLRHDHRQPQRAARDQASGATFTTSSAVVTPAATFMAPETRSGFIPSLYACSRILASS